MKPFTKKIAKEIAEKSFGYVLDCILGYSDSGYSLSDKAESFEQNFEEDIESMGITITPHRVKLCAEQYNLMAEKFEKMIRAKYYK